MTDITIRPGFADEPESRRLISELDTELNQFYPKEHMFGLHPNEERDSALHFFLLEEPGLAIGCGALRVLNSTYAEIKRMYVRPSHRRRGLSRLMMQTLEKKANQLGIQFLRLETGPEQLEAIALYRSEGFYEIPVYGEYIGSPVSFCMEKRLTSD